ANAVEGRFSAERNLLFAQIYDVNRPWVQAFNWKVSGVAVGVILATAIAIFFSRRYVKQWSELWWLLLVLACASSFLMLPPSAFRLSPMRFTLAMAIVASRCLRHSTLMSASTMRIVLLLLPRIQRMVRPSACSSTSRSGPLNEEFFQRTPRMP